MAVMEGDNSEGGSSDTQQDAFEPQPGDIIIALMGVMGAGKSTLIAHCTDQPVAVNMGLQSCKFWARHGTSPSLHDYDKLTTALRSLLRDLNETYSRILTSIPEGRRDKASRILQFLIYSVRPLKVQEAVDAIAIPLDAHRQFDPKYRLPCPNEIARFCSSLVSLVTRRSNEEMVTELELAHFSVKGYLTSESPPEPFRDRLSEADARSCTVDVPEEEGRLLRLLHPSFREFLLGSQRCSNTTFCIDAKEAHQHLFECCLRVMSSFLRRDMCDLRRPGTRVGDVLRSHVNKNVPFAT